VTFVKNEAQTRNDKKRGLMPARTSTPYREDGTRAKARSVSRIFQYCPQVCLGGETVGRIRIASVPDLGVVLGDAFFHHRRQIDKGFDETWHEFIKHAEQIVDNKHLTVTMGTGANAYSGNLD